IASIGLISLFNYSIFPFIFSAISLFNILVASQKSFAQALMNFLPIRIPIELFINLKKRLPTFIFRYKP
ncbi:MAG: hypothetical protein KDD26_07215, partial [Winogradskyella sp.]|nr:hypothetical protein [Winogradskyella sp.]